MKCQKCGSKLKVLDTVYPDENKTYRRRRCPDCDRIFYTCEYMVTIDKEFMDEWYASQKMNLRMNSPDVNYAHWVISTNPDDYKGLGTAKCSSCGLFIPVGRGRLPHKCPSCKSIMDY